MALTWLHLSDFHIPAYDSYDKDVVLRALVSSVGRLREAGHEPDLIFATGDIAAKGKAAEYELASVLFDDLLAAAGLERRHLFVIPGNHDVDREQGIGLARTLASREESDEYFRPGSPIPHLKLKQTAFRAWYDDFFSGIRSCSGSSCGPVEQIELKGKRIAVLPINSALFCADDHDHAKLWVGRRALDASLARLDETSADLRIALIHHPLDWLADMERANVRTALLDNVDFLLRGHLHENETTQIVFRHGTMIDMAAGAAYQTRRWPNRAQYVMVDDQALMVFPIRYEDSPKEIWTLDPSLFPEEEDHVGRFNLRVSPDPPTRDESSGQTRVETSPAFRSNVPSTRGLAVVGREEELNQIAGAFDDLTKEQVLVLTGTPGVGKSELAREFARRHHDRYPGGTFLVDATSAELPVDLARIGSAFLGLEFPEGMKLEDQCQRTLVNLGGAPTLLIYDNVHSFSALERWLPPAGMSCHVIITTVHEPVAVGWESLNVEPLSEKQSEALVKALAGSKVWEKYGPALTTHAGGLPVQLCPTASVLAYEERRGRDAKQHLSALADETQKSFSLVYRLLDSPVRLLLHAAAGLNPQRISEAALAADIQKGAKWSESKFNMALDACVDVHLLEGESGRLRMHQLLVSFLKSAGEEENRKTLESIRKVQRDRLATVASALSQNPADGRLAADLLGFRLLPDEWESMDLPIAGELRSSLGRALLEIGEFAKARSWYEEAVEETRQGDAKGQVNHSELSVRLHQVGYCHAKEGEFAEARPWFEEAVEEARKACTGGRVDHASIGNSLHQVGFCHSSEGEFAEARSWFEGAVEEKRKGDINERVDHASLGISLHQVGFCHSSEGEFAEARPWYEQAVEEKRPGDINGRVDHESLGNSLHQVGVCYSSEGEFAEARPWYEEAVEEKRQGDIHGRVNHANLGISLHQVGFCHSSEGDFAEARPWYEQAVEESRTGDVYGRVDHESLGNSLHQVGFCHSRTGEFAEARPWYEEAVEEKRQGDIHGRVNHASVGTSLHEVGFSHSSEGEFAEARPWYEEAVEESRKGDVYGRMDHEGLGNGLNQVGLCLLSEGEFAEARSWLERGVEEKRQGDIHGRVDHESLGNGLHQIGYCHSSEGEFSEARPWFEEAVEEARKGDVYGRVDHQSLGTSLHQVGHCHASEGEFAEARPWYEEAVEQIRRGNVHGRVDRQRLASCLRSSARCLEELGKPDEAGELQAEAKSLEGQGP